ncbi:Fc.00g089820.m01.CDS01 [Cosmosporella sp. VM-42]
MLQQQIFQEVLQTTADSARAWQAYFTLLGRMAHYDKMSYFDVPDELLVSWFRSEQYPRSPWGLNWGMLVLGIHFILVSLIVVVFVMKTKVPRVGGNVWQCLTQVNSDEMADMLRSLTMATDSDVKDKLAVKGSGSGIVYLGRVVDEEEHSDLIVGLRKRAEQ